MEGGGGQYVCVCVWVEGDALKLLYVLCKVGNGGSQV